MTRRKWMSGISVGLAIAWVGGCMSQIHFAAPENMGIELDDEPYVVPFKVDLAEGCTKALCLTNIPSHPGLEVWATLKVKSRTIKSAHFRDHCTIPVVFEADDFDQVLANNLVTKVIYLPDPEYQEVAIGGAGVATETLVSTRLEPGEDPIREAQKKGTVLAVVRMGNRVPVGRPALPASVERTMQTGPQLKPE